jgi:hypothetical protein
VSRCSGKEIGKPGEGYIVAVSVAFWFKCSSSVAIDLLVGQMGQPHGQMGQMNGQMGQMGQPHGQMGQMNGQMGQMNGQMGQMGQPHKWLRWVSHTVRWVR